MIHSFGDLLRPGDYKLHSKFRSAVNFVRGNSLTSVVTEDVGPGPVNIVVNDIRGIECLRVETDAIWINGIPYPLEIEMRYDSRIKIPHPLDSEKLSANINSAAKILAKSAAPKSMAFLLDRTREANFKGSFEREFTRWAHVGAALLFGGDPAGGASRLRGLGIGFTPSGDDFLAGTLAAYSISLQLLYGELLDKIETIYRHGLGGNPVSNALLSCAQLGYLPARHKSAAEAIVGFDDVKLRLCLEDLIGVGETSGADFAVGFVMALKEGTKKGRYRKCLHGAA